jgi:hypothetical protein
LLVLALIIGGWLMLRVMLWQSPFATPVAIIASAARAALSAAANPPVRDTGPGQTAPSPVPGPADAPVAAPLPAPWLAAPAPISPPSPADAFERRPARQIVGQQLLLAAAFAHMELPPEIASYFGAPRRRGSPAPTLAAAARDPPGKAAIRPATVAARWTGDAWMMLRNGSSGPIAVGEPSYGRSQAGAVLRYRLVPSRGPRPVAYVRTTRALAGPREEEVAVGLSARPVAGLPLRVAGEMRVSEGSAGREARPAGYAVTELPPAKLPLGLRAEAYAQAGYVGGRYATAFVDGQARIDGRVVRLAPASELRAGGGVWGGAQRHAGRLDIGPTATVNLRLGETQSRVALDYRVRVAGNAAPKSGPALTISAGF